MALVRLRAAGVCETRKVYFGLNTYYFVPKSTKFGFSFLPNPPRYTSTVTTSPQNVNFPLFYRCWRRPHTSVYELFADILGRRDTPAHTLTFTSLTENECKKQCEKIQLN